MADLTLTAEKLNDLKAKVKAEMARRSATEHSASLSSYGDSSWDFEIAPGETVKDEHLKKIIDPLLHVADFQADNRLIGDRSGVTITYEQAEKFVEDLAARAKTAKESGCRGSCIGM